MPATMFDGPTFHRRSDVVSVLLSSLEEREAAVTEREAAVARRERALEFEERFHELNGRGRRSTGAEADTLVATVRTFERPQRERFHTTFRLRELEWWTKQLGCAPALT